MPTLQKQLWFRQTVLTLMLTISLGLILSAATIVLDLFEEQEAAEKNARDVVSAMRFQAAQAVFNIDSELADTVTQGLSGYALFQEVRIVDDIGEDLSLATRPPVSGPLTPIADYLFETDTPIVVLLHHDKVSGSLGRIEVRLDNYLVAHRFFIRSFRTIIGSLIRNIIFSGCLLALFYTTLTRPIVSIAEQISKVDPRHPNKELKTPIMHAESEIGRMTHAFNDLLHRLRTVQEQQKNAEDRLTEHQKLLEEKIAQRTQELVIANQKLSDLASKDSLTGILNRRVFTEYAERDLAKAKREQQAISLMILDLDKFKSVNDTYGHNVGDTVLIEFSQCVLNTIRKHDLFARFGGEEFIAMFSGASQESAVKLAQKICDNFAQTPIEIKGQTHYFTVSIGITMTTTPASFDLLTLIKKADEALYLAKSNGRNRIEFHEC